MLRGFFNLYGDHELTETIFNGRHILQCSAHCLRYFAILSVIKIHLYCQLQYVPCHFFSMMPSIHWITIISSRRLEIVFRSIWFLWDRKKLSKCIRLSKEYDLITSCCHKSIYLGFYFFKWDWSLGKTDIDFFANCSRFCTKMAVSIISVDKGELFFTLSRQFEVGTISSA